MVELRDSVEWNQDTKLFTAQSGNEAIFVHGRSYLIGRVNKNLIARLVAMQVIDLFEVIQIDDENAQSRILEIGLSKQIVRCVHKGAAIGETGHLIGSSEVRHGQHLLVVSVALMTDNRAA